MRHNRYVLIVLLVCAALGLQGIPASAVTTPWSGTASLSVTASSYTTNQSAPGVTATVTPTLSGGYYLSVYDDLGHLICTQTPGYGSSCSGTASAPLDGSRTYTAYVAYGTPPNAGPPTNDVRATSGGASVTRTGYAGTLTLTTPNSVVDSGQITVTATATPPPGYPYTVSLYRADTAQLLTTCASTCSLSVSAPADGKYYTLAAYVAVGAPSTSLPTQNVARSATLTITNSNSNAPDYALLLAPYVAGKSIEEFCLAVADVPQPRTPASGTPGVLGSACLTAEAAGKTLPDVVKAIIAAAGAAGGAALAYTVLDQVLSNTGTADPTAPHQTPSPQAQPSPTPSGLPSGPDDQLLDAMRARRQGPSTQEWSDAALENVVTQCRNLVAQYGVSLAGDGSQRCDNRPIFVPSAYDAPGPTANDLAGIVRNPTWLLLHYVDGSVKPRTSPGWYDTAAYRPNNCSTRDPSVEDCDEYPFYSSAEGGPDNLRAAGSPLPQLAPTDPYENRSVEGTRLNSMYKGCGMQSGATPTDQSVPQSEYLVIPIPVKELGVPTGYLC